MAIAIWDSAALHRLAACFHSTSGIVGDWVSGHSFRNQQFQIASILSDPFNRCTEARVELRYPPLYAVIRDTPV